MFLVSIPAFHYIQLHGYEIVITLLVPKSAEQEEYAEQQTRK